MPRLRLALSLVLSLPLCLMAGCSADFTTEGAPATDSGGGVPDAPGEEEPADPYPGCPSVNASVTAQVPTVMLLLDRSASMTIDFGLGRDRWEAMYDTLLGSNDALVPQLEDQVEFGMTLYTGRPDIGCPILDEVAPTRGNYQAIDDEFRSQDPLKDTPTGESLDLVTANLSSLQTSGPKAIVVATDGLPDSCEDPDEEGNVAAQQLAVAAAGRAHDAGIDTYIISVGPEVTDAHLQEMANAGVGLPPQGAQNAPFYKALNAQELDDAFSGIIAGVRGCAFDLDQEVLDPASGEVHLDGRVLDEGVDWQLTGNSVIELLGAACDELLDGSEHDVQAVFECSNGGVVE